MKRKAHELEFISQINRDGLGTSKVSDEYMNTLLQNPLVKDDEFELIGLSLSEGTFIAVNFNAFVVRIKPI